MAESIAAAPAHDGPVVIDAAVIRTELVMPPSVALETAKGFSLDLVKPIMSGRTNEVVDLAPDDTCRGVAM